MPPLILQLTIKSLFLPSSFEMNEAALKYMGSSQYELRDRAYYTFLLQKDGNLPMLVPEHTTIITERQNANILLSSIEDVEEVWTEVRI